MKLHGHDVATGGSAFQEDGPGNAVWQRAQQLALEEQARDRRN